MSVGMAVGPIMQQSAGGGGGFDLATDIAWKALWWAEGSGFQALGLSDGDLVTSWPDEIGTADAAPYATGPTFNAANASFNSKPAARFDSLHNDLVATLASSTPQPCTIVAAIRSETQDVNARALFGNSGGARVLTSSSGVGEWRMAAPTSASGGSTKFLGTTTDAVSIEAEFDGASSRMREDGATVATVNPGTDALLAAFGINTFAPSDVAGVVMSFAFIGIYDGVFANDASYLDFKTWVADHYAIAIA